MFLLICALLCLKIVKSSDRCEAAAELDACYHQNADDVSI